MKFMKILLSLMLLLTLSWSCSTRSGADGEEVSSTEGAEESDFVVDSQEEDLKIDDDTSVASSEPTPKEGPTPAQEESFSVNDADESASAAAPVVTTTGDTDTYIVKRGETLMMIAFKIYGDYTKWVDIKNLNPNVNHHSLSTGDALKYQVPSQKFTWQPSGDPYLIKKHDTLGKISNEKYGTYAKWRSLWENNKPLIKNPNLIFAGFTLYYIPQRDLASEL